MKNNRLVELPESLADLRELKLLNISQNNIEKLPDEVGSLLQLQRLDAAYNVLEDLPITFGNCTTLEQLDLDTNKLRDLPPNFSQLVCVIKTVLAVVLHNNMLIQVPIPLTLSILYPNWLIPNQLSQTVWQNMRLTLLTVRVDSLPPRLCLFAGACSD